MNKTKLYKDIISDENIFSAIYCLESYIFERNLLSENDLVLYYNLKDKHNISLITETIKECKDMLIDVLENNKNLEIQVYFKAKKYNKEKQSVECRPMHSASLITQICIVCLLNKVMFRETKTGKREFSDLTQLLPSNFFGNMPSSMPEDIFYDWKNKYKEYSDNIISSYDVAKETGNYKYEVTLDLSNYFPSINPNIIYNFSIKKLSATYKENELSMLKKVFQKLLVFDVSNLNTNKVKKKYYGENKIPKKSVNLGVPQGLPQSYYFGNLCMVMISQEFNNKFPGDSFYYVDDSVIYTNSENASEENFQKSLNELNKTIENALSHFSEKNIVNENFKYSIQVHTEEKSISSEILMSNKMSRALLMPYTLEASNISRELNSTLDSIEDHMLAEKLNALNIAIENEIANVKIHIKQIEEKEVGNAQQKGSFDIYLKSLKRYKKFFLYRKKLLEFRNEKDIESIRNSFAKKYFYLSENLSTDKIIELFNIFEEDIFLAEAQLIYNNIVSNEDKLKFKEELKSFEQKLLNDIPESLLFFNKNLENIAVDSSPFKTLATVAKNRMPDYSKATREVVFREIEKCLKDHQTKDFLGYGVGYDKFIFKFSNEYKRKILNASISKFFNIELTDNIEVFTKDNRALKYLELRLLSFLRNRNCIISDFIKFAVDIIAENGENFDTDYEKVDFSLYEVLNLFTFYVKNPVQVDSLILVHKYVSSIWKNGSKFLYFYTLHNQEHSIELIRATIKICKSIDYLQLKTSDFYILFLSCYLHDISMVLQPSIDEITRETKETDIIYTEVSEMLETICKTEKESVKQLIKYSFEKASNFFETISRDGHAYDSGKFIKSSSDLQFLDKTIRSFTANVSEAHGYDVNDIYGLKSKAKSEIISEKYMKILLRLADLLDGAKDRVSLNILNQNILNMPSISKYHWITHAAIDSFSLTSKYFFDKSKEITESQELFKSVLDKSSLREIILVEINLNAYSLIGIESTPCHGIQASLDNNEGQVKIIFDDKISCEGVNCNFLCKWMCDKNNYLIKELSALQQYLNRNANNIFNTKIELHYVFEHAQSLESKHFDIINNHINAK